MTKIIRPVQGVGEIALGLYSSGATFDERLLKTISNSSEYKRSSSMETNKVKNFMTPSGGTWASINRVDTVDASITMYNWSPDVLAFQLWGISSIVSATAIVDEPHVANAGAFVPTKRIINTSVAPVVKKGVAVVDTDDYTVSSGGIEFVDTLTTSGLIDGDDILISYTPMPGFNIEALVTSAPLVSVFFNGINAYDGKPFTDRIWKARLGLPSDFSLIASEIQPLQVSLAIEQDTTIIGTGLSQYFQHQIAS